MDKLKVKVEKVNIGKYDVDSVCLTIDKKPLEICFSKSEKIEQYKGKEVYLSKNKGVFKIELI